MTNSGLLGRTLHLVVISACLWCVSCAATQEDRVKVDKSRSTMDALDVNASTTALPQASPVSLSVMTGFGWLVIVLGFLACAINACILLLSICIKGAYGTVLKLTFGLAAADCWTSFFMAFAFLFYLNYIKVAKYSKCLLLMLEIFRMGSIFTSILHLLIMAINHYQQIHVQQSSGAVFSGKMISILMVLAWIVPTVVFFIGFFSVPNDGFRKLLSYNNDASDCHDGFMEDLGYRVSIYVSLLLPVLIMIALYAFMMRSLYAMEKQFQRQNKRSRSVRMKRKMLLTIILMITSFLIGWVPSGTWLLLMTPGNGISASIKKNHSVLSFSAGVIVNLLMVLKFLVNPIIYALRIPEIHDVLNRRFSKKNTFISTALTSFASKNQISKERSEKSGLIDNGGSVPMARNSEFFAEAEGVQNYSVC